MTMVVISALHLSFESPLETMETQVTGSTQPVACASCHNVVQASDAFCARCGTPLSGSAAPTAYKYGAAASRALSDMADRLSAFTSTGKLEGFSLKGFFSETFRRRSPQEIEDYLLAGTSRTTPN